MQVEMPDGNQDIGLELSSLVSLILKWELSAGRGMCCFLIAAVIDYHKCIWLKALHIYHLTVLEVSSLKCFPERTSTCQQACVPSGASRSIHLRVCSRF